MLRNKGKERERLREVREARQGSSERNLAAIKRTLRISGVREGKCHSACKESKEIGRELS